MAHHINKEKNHSSGSHQFTSGDACVYRFIHRLKPRAKLHIVSEFHHCITYSVKNTHFFTEKSLSQPQKRILVSWYHKLMGEFFRLLWRNVNAHGKERKCFHTWKRQKVLQNSPNQPSFGETKY